MNRLDVRDFRYARLREVRVSARGFNSGFSSASIRLQAPKCTFSNFWCIVVENGYT